MYAGGGRRRDALSFSVNVEVGGRGEVCRGRSFWGGEVRLVGSLVGIGARVEGWCCDGGVEEENSRCEEKGGGGSVAAAGGNERRGRVSGSVIIIVMCRYLGAIDRWNVNISLYM